MNCKLVEKHKIYQGAKFHVFLFSHLATRGLQIVKKLKKTTKNQNNVLGQSNYGLTQDKLQQKRFHLYSFRIDPLNIILKIYFNIIRGRGPNMLIYVN